MSRSVLIGAVVVLALGACADEQPATETVKAVPATAISAAPAVPGSLPPGSVLAPSSPPPATTTTTASTTTTLPIANLDLKLAEVARGFEQPVLALSPPGDSRLFVVDQPGRIWVFGDDGSEVFVDLRDDVVFGGERGLLGLAFHPDYADNGRFFVNYTGVGGATRISELQASPDRNSARGDGQQILLEIGQPARNHNGGMIGFGPDGHLWIATGDGGGANDRFDQGQRPDTLLGALLRVDVSVPGEYSIPDDNPFIAGGGAPEVWAYGLRNPWRFTFDDALLYVADVGQNKYEEINRIPVDASRGGNFGWPLFEGIDCFHGPCDETDTIAPVVVYGHDEGCSVTGGYVYRGSAIPELAGHYFYGDYCGGWIRSLSPAGETFDWISASGDRAITSFGRDAAGEVYVVVAGGAIFRLERA
jgi:glucose/arabinose dehydrogenase